MFGKGDFNNATMQVGLQDASGNILPEQEQMRADAYWRYFEKYHVPRLIAQIMEQMVDQGMPPPPGLEEMAFGGLGGSEGDDENPESVTDDGYSGDEPDDDSGADDFDPEGDMLDSEETGEKDSEEEYESEEDATEPDEESEEDEVTGGKMKSTNYSANAGAAPKSVQDEIALLKKQLAEAQKQNAIHQVRQELSQISNYQLDPDTEVGLVTVLAGLNDDDRKIVLESLERLVPRSKEDVGGVPNLATHLYQGDAAPRAAKKDGFSVSESVRIGEIMSERGVSYREAVKIFQKEQK